jgi:hypothetical protein
MEGADYRGEEWNAGEMLTTGGDEGKQPEFEEGRTSCWPWWSARCPANRDAPADLRRREVAHHARLGVQDLLAALVSSGCAPTALLRGKSRGGRRRARRPGFPQGGSALARDCRAATALGEEAARAHARAWPRPFMGARGGAGQHTGRGDSAMACLPMGLAGLAAGPKRVRGLGRRGWTGPELAEN